MNESQDLKAAYGLILARADTKAPYKYLTYKLSKPCKHFVLRILPKKWMYLLTLLNIEKMRDDYYKRGKFSNNSEIGHNVNHRLKLKKSY